jgi:glycosyltransferase involved in cell wall biosynthesis
MPTHPLFSILIANYNNGKYLMDAINSVRQQTYTNWEIIIVDDCSTDNSREVYQALEQDPQIRIYYNEQNRGCGYTKRRCAELAQGELCGFLDPDDALLPEALEVMVKAHAEHREVSLVHSKWVMCDEQMNALYEATGKMQCPEGTDYLHYNRGIITAFAAFKNALYKSTEGINAAFMRAVDQDLYYKLEEVGATFFVDQVLYKYREHADCISLNNNVHKAYCWHFQAIEDACVRRGIPSDAELIVSDLLNLYTSGFQSTMDLQSRTLRNPIVKSVCKMLRMFKVLK